MNDAIEVTTPTDAEIIVSRLFDAAPALVFDCHTKPGLVRRWLLGPPGWTMPVCEIDLRVGGAFRYVWRSEAADREFGTGGVFTEIAAPHRWAHTEIMDGYPTESNNLYTLTEEGGRTRLTLCMNFGSKDVRDMVLKTGMTGGVGHSFDRLAAMLAEGPKA